MTVLVEQPNAEQEARKAAEAEATRAADAASAAAKAASEAVPEQYRGKTAAELAALLASQEASITTLRSEVGTNRRLVDELLNLRREPARAAAPAERPEVDALALAENPDATIRQVAREVAAETVLPAQQRVAALENELNEARLEKDYPAFKNTISGQDFVQWVQASPYRQSAAVAAAKGSWDAARELLQGYTDRPKAPAPAPAVELPVASGDEEPPVPARQPPKLAKGGNSGASAAATQGANGEKLYSKAALQKLYINNQDEYDRMYQTGDLAKAYKEGRVRD